MKTPKFGNSAKLVLERSLKVALARGDKHIGAEHITLAALQPAVGTVPRALDMRRRRPRGADQRAERLSRRAEWTVSSARITITPTATHSSGSDALRSSSAWPRYVAAAVIGSTPTTVVHV